ncbi:carbon-nitrogen hydrolase [Halomonas ventosae]|uniref:Carbon-nitrogen hydrolase n=1 Tax=Halomonas ventosae TaxID=229007 RepID=A0A2T0VMY3_9GAMM|nr:carbon-nitrogen hydrolase [Halomonas ventosae]
MDRVYDDIGGAWPRPTIDKLIMEWNNINIIAGSMIEVGEDDRLYNVAYLCHRDGQIERQAKLHITPQERRDWVIEGGDELLVFQTDAGRVGIQICYDVEFPSSRGCPCATLAPMCSLVLP